MHCVCVCDQMSAEAYAKAVDVPLPATAVRLLNFVAALPASKCTLSMVFPLQTIENARWQRRKQLIHCIWRSPLPRLHTPAPASPLTPMIGGRSPFSTPIPSDEVECDAETDAMVSELRPLLCDWRLLRLGGKLVASHIAGQVTSFLSDCCETGGCPRGVRFEEVTGKAYAHVE